MPSSVIRRFSYDAARRTMRVTFVSGDVYEYFNVPEAVSEDWRAAFSKGQYFAERIRDRYAYELVEKAGR